MTRSKNDDARSEMAGHFTMEINMAKAKEKIAAVQSVSEPAIIEEEAEEVMIDAVLLFERIPDYRFVDENGKMFRMELKSSGVYWLYPV